MTTQLSPPPVFRAVDNSGNSLVGGLLYTYAAGTSTPQATYVDSTQTTQNTNPVVLNARGEANVWLSTSLIYKLILQDAAANQIWAIDNVNGGYISSNAIQSWEPAWGPTDLHIADSVGQNVIVGSSLNQLAINTTAFPTGVTGYGRLNTAGNAVFGMFGRSDTYVSGSGGVAQELNANNFAGAPSTMLPASQGIGTTEINAIGLQLVPYGTYNSNIAQQIVGGTGGAKQWLYGLYFSPYSCTTYGLFIDATSTSTQTSAVIKCSQNNLALQLQQVGTPDATHAVVEYYDGNGVAQWTMKQVGTHVYGPLVSAKGPLTTNFASANFTIIGSTTNVSIQCLDTFNGTSQGFGLSITNSIDTVTQAAYYGVYIHNPVSVNSGTITAFSGLSIPDITTYVTSAYGITLALASGSGKYNIYASGTAPNYLAGDLQIPGAAQAILHALTTVTNGAGVSAGTLTNAPSVGNPTKWIPFNDAGTTRYIPSW